ncbi:MAG: hypothetical protein LWX56_04250 [Ignavibacteria bacterium]|nr:hypothetical protein [Ignavibacteria bacterium]
MKRLFIALFVIGTLISPSFAQNADSLKQPKKHAKAKVAEMKAEAKKAAAANAVTEKKTTPAKKADTKDKK